MGIIGSLFNWLSDYLSDKKQTVVGFLIISRTGNKRLLHQVLHLHGPISQQEFHRVLFLLFFFFFLRKSTFFFFFFFFFLIYINDIVSDVN